MFKVNNSILREIQARIGYEFVNKELLSAAFTHSSYVNEHTAVGNERIEFLGDCVLNFLVGERLFTSDPTASEGALSAKRAALVSRAPLARIVDSLGLIEYLQVGAGVNKSAFSVKARSDVFEALVGAVYMDGGLDGCRKLLDNIYYDAVEPERDYKSCIQQYAYAHGMEIAYDTESTGVEFKTILKVGDMVFVGTGKAKHASQIAAAKAAVNAIMPK